VVLELLGMDLDALRTHNAVAVGLEAEVGDRLLAVLVARHVVLEVGLHVLESEALRDVHQRGLSF
jgi:hypothetical protein